MSKLIKESIIIWPVFYSKQSNTTFLNLMLNHKNILLTRKIPLFGTTFGHSISDIYVHIVFRTIFWNSSIYRRTQPLHILETSNKPLVGAQITIIFESNRIGPALKRQMWSQTHCKVTILLSLKSWTRLYLETPKTIPFFGNKTGYLWRRIEPNWCTLY